ncbi:WG repeat-containing protein [Actinoplanes sp. NEAU-A12]|uniref:WG repeat-containing protein n=1 Tax=Actinoplanes sandaracinus TaxID=3045177 RepID=A0ABT6WEA4_9ACTN|nr:WG repeat-containing protein [Actinoplanes sandaracinus]MDI6098028.1 WG repeat-containing protein [Actinoplanes sandaracinus]
MPEQDPAYQGRRHAPEQQAPRQGGETRPVSGPAAPQGQSYGTARPAPATAFPAYPEDRRAARDGRVPDAPFDLRPAPQDRNSPAPSRPAAQPTRVTPQQPVMPPAAVYPGVPGQAPGPAMPAQGRGMPGGAAPVSGPVPPLAAGSREAPAGGRVPGYAAPAASGHIAPVSGPATQADQVAPGQQSPETTQALEVPGPARRATNPPHVTAGPDRYPPMEARQSTAAPSSGPGVSFPHGRISAEDGVPGGHHYDEEQDPTRPLDRRRLGHAAPPHGHPDSATHPDDPTRPFGLRRSGPAGERPQTTGPRPGVPAESRTPVDDPRQPGTPASGIPADERTQAVDPRRTGGPIPRPYGAERTASIDPRLPGAPVTGMHAAAGHLSEVDDRGFAVEPRQDGTGSPDRTGRHIEADGSREAGGWTPGLDDSSGTPSEAMAYGMEPATAPVTGPPATAGPADASDNEPETHGLGWLLSMSGLGATTPVPEAEPAAPSAAASVPEVRPLGWFAPADPDETLPEPDDTLPEADASLRADLTSPESGTAPAQAEHDTVRTHSASSEGRAEETDSASGGGLLTGRGPARDVPAPPGLIPSTPESVFGVDEGDALQAEASHPAERADAEHAAELAEAAYVAEHVEAEHAAGQADAEHAAEHAPATETVLSHSEQDVAADAPQTWPAGSDGSAVAGQAENIGVRYDEADLSAAEGTVDERETVGHATAGSAETEVVDAEIVDAEIVDGEVVDAEAIDGEIVEAEVVDAEADAEVIDAEATDAEAVDAGAVDAQVADAETVDTDTDTGTDVVQESAPGADAAADQAASGGPVAEWGNSGLDEDSVLTRTIQISPVSAPPADDVARDAVTGGTGEFRAEDVHSEAGYGDTTGNAAAGTTAVEPVAEEAPAPAADSGVETPAPVAADSMAEVPAPVAADSTVEAAVGDTAIEAAAGETVVEPTLAETAAESGQDVVPGENSESGVAGEDSASVDSDAEHAVAEPDRAEAEYEAEAEYQEEASATAHVEDVVAGDAEDEPVAASDEAGIVAGAAAVGTDADSSEGPEGESEPGTAGGSGSKGDGTADALTAEVAAPDEALTVEVAAPDEALTASEGDGTMALPQANEPAETPQADKTATTPQTSEPAETPQAEDAVLSPAVLDAAAPEKAAGEVDSAGAGSGEYVARAREGGASDVPPQGLTPEAESGGAAATSGEAGPRKAVPEARLPEARLPEAKVEPVRQRRDQRAPADRRRADPEQILAAYPWAYDPRTLREQVDEPDRLWDVADRLTDRLEFAERDNVRAGLLSLRAVVHRILGELDDALADGREALRHAETGGDLRTVAVVRARLAHVLQWRGDFDEADRLYARTDSVELPARLRAEIIELAGRSAFEQGRYLEAVNHFERALGVRRGEDPDLVERIELALDAISRRSSDGWGPYPRGRDELLGLPEAPVPLLDDGAGLWGYAAAVEPRYAEAQPFAEGVAWVRRPASSAWELIDQHGELVIPSAHGYLGAVRFAEGLAWVTREEDGGWFAIDRQNQLIVPAGGFEEARPFRSGLALVRQGGVWGAVDRQGRIVVEPRFRRFATVLHLGGAVDGFTDEGLAVVDEGDRFGVLDRTGQPVVAAVHAAVVIHPSAFLVRDAAGLWGALNRDGEPLVDVAHRDVASVVDLLPAESRPVL